MGSGWRCLHNFADTLFTAYAKLVVRFTAAIGVIGILLAVAFSLGLLISDVEKRDVNELWIDLDSRLVDEQEAFEQAFGGLTRKLTSIVSSSASGGALYHSNDTLAQNGSSALEALQDSMAIWARVNFTFENRSYDYRDVCEKALVPPLFRRGGRTATLYGLYAQCLATDSQFIALVYPTLRATMSSLPAAYTPVPAGWGIDEFPCNRASALDCFREGEEVDWPEALRQLGPAAFPLATAATTTYGAIRDQIGNQPTGLPPIPTLTVSEVLASGLVLPCWFGNPAASLTCLEPGVDLSNQTEVIAAIDGGLTRLNGFLSMLDASGQLAAVVGGSVAPVLSQLPMTTSQTEAEAVALQAKTVVLTTLSGAAGSNPVVGPLLVYLTLNDLTLSGMLPAETVIGGTCLSTAATTLAGVPPGTVNAAILGLQAELVGAARFFSSLGFYWRPSYRDMTSSQIVEHFNRAANAQLDPAVRADPTACILGRASCCQTWNGAFLGTSISIAGDARPQRRAVPNTALASLELATVTLVRSGWEDFNHNHPVWQDQLSQRYPAVQWSSEQRREDLARAFDTKITADWLRLYERRPGSQYASGEEHASLRFDFGTGNSLTDVLEDASSVDGTLLALSYGVMALLIVLSLGNYGAAIARLIGGGKEEAQLALVNSHGFLGLLGLGVIAVSSVAGLGLSSFFQITLNGLTVNLVPFVSLGLGIDDMFVLAHAMTALNDRSRSVKDNMCAVMRLAGPSVCLTSVANATAFILIYTVPIGAIRQLVLVLTVAVLVNLVLLFLLFVPLMVFDMKRNHANRMDLIFVKASAVRKCSSCSEESGTLMATFIDKYYAPLLSNVVAKLVIVVVFVVFCAVMLWSGIVNTEQGLRTSDIALRGTYQRDLAELAENVITIQKSNLLIISKNRQFREPQAQQQILDLMNSLEPSPWIVQGTRVHDVNFLANGSASLLSFYDLQQSGGALGMCPAANVTTPIAVPECYDSFFPRWYTGIGIALAPYLLCRDGNQTRVPCDSDGAMVTAARTNYYFDHLNEHQKYLDAISDVRSRVDPHSNGDVQAFSIGYIFYFWEQYYDIELTLIAAIGYGLLGVFIITFLFQLNPWMSAIICLVILMIDIELVGLMRPIGVKINAISIANLVISVGMAVEFTAHYARAFLLAPGNRNERMKVALHEMLQPMINGALSTIIALSVLSLNEFPFFRRYYALMFVVMVLVSFANGLILLPVILSLIGPPEVEGSTSSGSYDARTDPEDANGVDAKNGTEMRRVESIQSKQQIIT